MNDNSTLVNELYISRKNILAYLKKINYNTEELDNFSLAEINSMKNNTSDISELNFDVYHKDDNNKKCTVYYYLKNSIKKTAIQNIVSDYYEDSEENKLNNNIIIITLGNINDTIKNTISELWSKYKEYVAIYNIKNLQYNILEHKYVLEHIKLSLEEKKKLYNDLNINNDNELPEIGILDPIAKLILLRPGEVCKILRYEQNSYLTPYYRICKI